MTGLRATLFLRPPRVQLLGVHRPTTARRAPCAIRAQSFADDFNKKAREAQQAALKWAEEQKLKERAQQTLQQAASKVKATADTVQDSVQRTASQIDREWDVSKRAQEAAERVKEAADGVDSKYSLRMRARNIYNDVKRKWPTWQVRLSKFLETPLGQVAAVIFVVVLIQTGVLFHILRWFSLLLFIGPLIAAPYIQKKAMEAERERQAAYARAQQQAQQQAQQRRQSAFVNDLFGRFGGRRQQQQSAGAGGGFGRAQGGEGSVIDVEWDTVDDK